MHSVSTSLLRTPLGRQSPLPLSYAPELLCAVERTRFASINIPFGDDLWQLWELSWRNRWGAVQVGAARLVVPLDSPFVCESKSLKLYLLSLNDERFEQRDALAQRIATDVSRCCGAQVTFAWMESDSAAFEPAPSANDAASLCLDDLQSDSPEPQAPSPEAVVSALRSDPHSAVRPRAWHTHAFRSLCPVTGQPDWASVFIRYHGHAIEPRALLTYLLSFRHHGAMHESCVESIFGDMLREAAPEALSVDARFLRRGGIDINPYRATSADRPSFHRLWRQ